MKVVVNNNPKKKAYRPMPFEAPPKREPDKLNCIRVDVPYDLNDAEKGTFQVYLHVIEFEDENEHRIENFLHDIFSFDQVRAKKGINNGPGAFAMLRNHCRGQALVQVERLAAEYDRESLSNYEDLLKKLMRHFLPRKIYIQVRRMLRKRATHFHCVKM